MKYLTPFLAASYLGAHLLIAAEPAAVTPAKPVLKIIPGQVIVPTDAMRRIWGELVSVDPKTRTGTFRKEGTDELLRFTVMPYAELLHHAANGDLQDFRIGERAIFRLHENDQGEWVWLTYIQDEMNMMNGHKEYFYVDELDAKQGRITATQANFDQSFVREKGIVIETDPATRFWKGGAPAKFADIKVGDKLRTKTHGVGIGKTRVAWEVFLDDESLLKFQEEQRAVHDARMVEQGAPGYVDAADGEQVSLTMFNEGSVVTRQLKARLRIAVAPAGVDRVPTTTAISGTVSAVKTEGRLLKVTLNLSAPATKFQPAGLARLWLSRE